MEGSRRSFLKLAGICALGFGIKPAANALSAQAPAPAAAPAATGPYAPNPTALHGTQWAMVVDMKKCWDKGKEGCKDCILACHKTHNVPEIGNIKEEIKWLWTEPFPNAFPNMESHYMSEAFLHKPFMVLCNHCTNPPCVRVCPTQATYKRPQDGIVMMDFHRCIGCRYCMAACPFGARSFNFKEPRPFVKDVNPDFPSRERGVVEKCNFCEERLAVGQLPACVTACRVGALTFGNLGDPKSEVRKILSTTFTIRRKPELGTQPNVYYIV
ncbi:MAG TPA: 4Fe-4S ferredoxin [Syntrophobacteraceae bacterium]|nr:4Fe-4S ferredoxin [Syntrophobacteraceae bacterium]